MCEQARKRLTPGITLSTKFLERLDVEVAVTIVRVGSRLENGISLSGNVVGKLLDEGFQGHRHIPALMFSIASKPNSR
ncbi:hypothetical protein COEX109129_03870 [Corallococcus exiguus]